MKIDMFFIKFNKGRNYLGKKFRNYVFKKRLGRKIWSTKIIIFIMNLLEKNPPYINTGDIGNFDHYVPQLLLNRWRISETGTDKGQIYFWSKKNQTINKKSIKSVAGEIDWDTNMAESKPSDFISKKLYAELLETVGSFIIQFININKNPKLTLMEESTLSVFVAHQIIRVPKFRQALDKFFSLGYSKNLISIEDFGDKNILINKIVNNTINITYDQLNDEEPIKIISKTKQQKSHVSLAIASDIAEKIYQTRFLKFLEISNGDENEFVISDNPVVFLDMDRNTILEYVPWWEVGVHKFIIFMPISPKKALVYSPIKDEKDFPIESFIKLLNFGQYKNCTEGVFANNISLIQEHLKYYNL